MKHDEDSPRIVDEHLERMLRAVRQGALAADELDKAGFDDSIPAAPSFPSIPRIGTVIRGTWILSTLLGTGGFGTVFRGHHRTLGREDALKFLHPHLAYDDDLRTRFYNEARLMATLRNEYLVQVYDSGEHEGLPFLAMERLQGQSLHERLTQEGPLPLPIFRRIAIDILHGVAALHAKGVIHRDIKPANIFILAGTERVKLLDFGLAKTSLHLTSQRQPMGTPYYIAPELLALPNSSPCAATDIYSIGVVLYHMLTGRLPIPLNEKCSIYDPTSHGTDLRIPAPSELRSGTPTGLSDLIMRSISHVVTHRPTTALEFVHLLNTCIHTPRKWPIAKLPPKLRPQSRPHQTGQANLRTQGEFEHGGSEIRIEGARDYARQSIIIQNQYLAPLARETTHSESQRTWRTPWTPWTWNFLRSLLARIRAIRLGKTKTLL